MLLGGSCRDFGWDFEELLECVRDECSEARVVLTLDSV